MYYLHTDPIYIYSLMLAAALAALPQQGYGQKRKRSELCAPRDNTTGGLEQANQFNSHTNTWKRKKVDRHHTDILSKRSAKCFSICMSFFRYAILKFPIMLKNRGSRAMWVNGAALCCQQTICEISVTVVSCPHPPHHGFGVWRIHSKMRCGAWFFDGRTL